MRILHISPSDVDGGASKGAYRLHTALRQHGVDSHMLVQRKYTDDPSVQTTRTSYVAMFDGLRDRLDRLPLKLYNWQRYNWWTVGWLPFAIADRVREIAPDVVQFHWTGRGAAPIGTLSQLRNYPIVWTLRDMWPLTGGCHYSAGCERYLTGCGSCPQLESGSRFDISWWQWRRKRKAWQDLKVTFIALSNWMAERAAVSPLTFGNEIVVIPNGIDVDRYAPSAKAAAREAWRLPQDRKIILYGALNSTADPRKGFRYLDEALQRLDRQGWGDRVQVVVFGASSGSVSHRLPIHYVGHLRDDVSLSLLYAAADVMIIPSVEDNLPKTAIEAMACGVPLAAFANTGQLDIVDHKVNGYLAENLSAEDLATGIAWCLEEDQRNPGLGLRAREKALRSFDMRSVVLKHVALYCRLLGHRVPSEAEDAIPDAGHPGPGLGNWPQLAMNGGNAPLRRQGGH